MVWTPERSRKGGPLSLQAIAWRTLRDHISTGNVLELMKIARQVALRQSNSTSSAAAGSNTLRIVPSNKASWQNCLLCCLSPSQLHMPVDVEGHCMRYITRAYVLLRERCSKEDLRQALGPQLSEQLEVAAVEAERLAVKCKAIDWGRVLEPPAPDCTALQIQSVGGHPHSYSYCALVCGVLWPEDVDPQAREDHLSPDEFKQVFEMDFEQYSGLPAWKKRVLKQERRLF